MVHRHFRPEHILIDGELRVSVSGIGLAPFVPQVVLLLHEKKFRCEISFLSSIMPAAQLQLSDYCGATMSYEPPEAAGPGAAWTAKGDVYSFGVVMLQLLTGRKPYDR